VGGKEKETERERESKRARERYVFDGYRMSGRGRGER